MHSTRPGKLNNVDPITRDSRLAVAILLFGLAVASLGASLGLNVWPGIEFVDVTGRKGGIEVVVWLFGFAPTIAVIFWASAPPPSQQSLVLAGWTVTIAALTWTLRASLSWQLSFSDALSWSGFLTVAMALPCAIALAWRLLRSAESVLMLRLRWLIGLALLFVLAPGPLLNLGAALHPLSVDLFALHFDRLAGLGFTPVLSDFVRQTLSLPQWVGLA